MENRPFETIAAISIFLTMSALPASVRADAVIKNNTRAVAKATESNNFNSYDPCIDRFFSFPIVPREKVPATSDTQYKEALSEFETCQHACEEKRKEAEIPILAEARTCRSREGATARERELCDELAHCKTVSDPSWAKWQTCGCHCNVVFHHSIFGGTIAGPGLFQSHGAKVPSLDGAGKNH